MTPLTSQLCITKLTIPTTRQLTPKLKLTTSMSLRPVVRRDASLQPRKKSQRSKKSTPEIGKQTARDSWILFGSAKTHYRSGIIFHRIYFVSLLRLKIICQLIIAESRWTSWSIQIITGSSILQWT